MTGGQPTPPMPDGPGPGVPGGPGPDPGMPGEPDFGAPGPDGGAAAGTGRRRVHPVTPLLNSFSALAAFLVVLIVNVPQLIGPLGALRDNTRDAGIIAVLGVTAAAAAILAAIVAANWVSWRYRFYEVTPDEIRTGSGWLVRSRRSARLDRVQAVDVNQPLFVRLFGLAELKVETAGGAGSDLTVKYLRLDECRRLRDGTLEATRRKQRETGASASASEGPEAGGASGDGQVGSAAGGPGVHGTGPAGPAAAAHPPMAPAIAPAAETTLHGPVPPQRLFASAVLGPGLLFFVALPVLFTAVIVVLGFAGVGGADDPWQLMLIVGGALAGTTFLGVAVYAVGLVATVWARWNTFHGFTLGADDDAGRLTVRAGLTSTRRQTIPVHRIHALEIVEPAWWRPAKWAQLRANVAGYVGDDQATSTTLLPVAPLAEADAILDGVIGRITDMHRAPSEAKWSSPPEALWVSPVDWRNQTVRITPRALVVTRGRLRRRRAVIPWARIQGFTLVQGPISRRLGLAGVRVDLVSGPVSVIAADLTTADAARVMRVIADRKFT